MTHTSPSVSMPPGQHPDAVCFRPMPEPEARKYLTSAGFLEGENFQREKLFSASRGLSALLMAVCSGDCVERFLDAVFNEDEETIARCIAGAYRILGEPVPKHLAALAAFPDVWSDVICVSSVLIEDGNDPAGIERTRRISELFRSGGKGPAIQKTHPNAKNRVLVLFFLAGVVRATTGFSEIRRPEVALKLFLRFAVAKAVVTYSMDILQAVYRIAQGILSKVSSHAGSFLTEGVRLPDVIEQKILACGFLDSIPLFSVLSALVAVGVYFGLRNILGTETVSWLCVVSALPFGILGFVKYHGMTAEQFLKAYVRSEFLMPKQLISRPMNLYREILDQTEWKEVLAHD